MSDLGSSLPDPSVAHMPEEGARLAVTFAAAVRAAGLEAPIGSVLMLTEALAAVGLTAPGAVYWAGRATLVREPGGVATYDRAFVSFWTGTPLEDVEVPRVHSVVLATDDPATPPEAPGGIDTGSTLTVRYSAAESLRRRDFARCSPEELAETYRLMAGMRISRSTRRSRRLVPARRGRGRPDLRRTVRSALRAGGEPIHQRRSRPLEQPRRVVLLCDISGSMDPYARALLRFVHSAVSARTRVEAFALGTRLTRLTRQLSWRDPDVALARAASSVVDWSGGTRLGEGIEEFNRSWGLRGLARGAVVVILSDGWDRGDPALLAGEMARLARVAHRVVWVNPLKASPGYEPLARGMAAALPFVDDFVEGHSLASLDELAEVMAR